MKERAHRAGSEFEKLVGIMDTLRGEEGCPWDREQDEKTIVHYFLEEVYEAVEALYEGNAEGLAEELGDVMMEVVFLAKIYAEKGKFTIVDSLEEINRKMVRRHPHVFSGKEIKTAGKVVREWQRQKKEEKERSGVFNGLSSYSPSLLKAFQIGRRVSAFGFDWDSARDALRKVKEEILELEKAMEMKKKEDMFQEVGDLLFSMTNVSRLLGLNPELALKKAGEKFMERFRELERRLKAKGKDLCEATLEEMDRIWEEIKESKKR